MISGELVHASRGGLGLVVGVLSPKGDLAASRWSLEFRGESCASIRTVCLCPRRMLL